MKNDHIGKIKKINKKAVFAVVLMLVLCFCGW